MIVMICLGVFFKHVSESHLPSKVEHVCVGVVERKNDPRRTVQVVFQ